MPENGFAVIGWGRVGASLAHRMAGEGWRCVAVRRRSLDAPASPALPEGAVVDTWTNPEEWPVPRLLLVTVPDRELGRVAAAAAARLDLAGRTVIHTSGLHPSGVLEPCRRRGAAVASWHPLLSFASVPLPAPTWRGAPCAIEGDDAAVELGRLLASSLGLLPWSIPPEAKARYHAAAAVAGNLTHLCVTAALQLLAGTGMPADGVDSPLGPLVRSAVGAALEGRGLATLTGAIARDDRETIARHLAALPPDLADAYASLARWARSQD